MKKVSGFLAATPLGTWFKVFMAGVLLQVFNGLAEGIPLFSFDIKMVEKIVTAGLVALLPVAINYFNPNDKRYGPDIEK